MALKKTYGMNALEVSTTFRVNGKTVRVSFTDGVPTGIGKRSARYTTEDPVMQAAIEADERFNETIFIERIWNVEAKKKAEVKGKGKEAFTEYPYIKRFQDAVNILVSKYKADINALQNRADLKAACEKYKVSFPNMR